MLNQTKDWLAPAVSPQSDPQLPIGSLQAEHKCCRPTQPITSTCSIVAVIQKHTGISIWGKSISIRITSHDHQILHEFIQIPLNTYPHRQPLLHLVVANSNPLDSGLSCSYNPIVSTAKTVLSNITKCFIIEFLNCWQHQKQQNISLSQTLSSVL